MIKQSFLKMTNTTVCGITSDKEELPAYRYKMRCVELEMPQTLIPYTKSFTS